jgi:hypothetical protein
MSASIILCADAKEQTEKRNAYKRFAKGNGTFVRVERNTVVLTGGDSVSFVIEDAPKMGEEPVLYGGYRDMRDVCGEIDVSKEAPEAARIRKIARDMME